MAVPLSTVQRLPKDLDIKPSQNLIEWMPLIIDRSTLPSETSKSSSAFGSIVFAVSPFVKSPVPINRSFQERVPLEAIAASLSALWFPSLSRI
ncbi:hypothetical protein F383_24187 [Gossypium arboreum]|uniref:Uncharacterized protein n=1 Tax=Gossypium arboreum TaxID=29729 RepID=A0A0B0P5E8_GOSAR|nr:hypothetical protein F383_24187 [Gossypium arboreum]